MSNGTVKIHGKDYKTVALRVSEFREQHPDWAILTEITENTEERVVMRAMVGRPSEDGRTIIPVGVGFAEERRDSSQINRTSALENCETSAIGRALAACGYGGTEYASANEVENAIHQQKVKIDPKQKKEFVKQVTEALQNGDDEYIRELWSEWTNDEKVVLWPEFNSQQRSAMKKIGASA